MAENEDGNRLIDIRDRLDAKRAIVFLHGFSGNEEDTWGKFPLLLGVEDALRDWDIYSLGYNTSLLPDIRGIWSSDPDLPTLAKHLQTRINLDPLGRYEDLAFIAHSMGGLVMQKAIVEDDALTARIRFLLLMGTPSAGLNKAKSGFFWKRSIKNMSSNSAFIKGLRRQWNERFEKRYPFQFTVVAGDKDQFVPPDSSLGPFDASLQRVILGDHLSMVKPDDRKAESFKLVMAILAHESEPEGVQSAVRFQTEFSADISGGGIAGDTFEAVVVKGESESDIVLKALKLDHDGKREESVRFLMENRKAGTDALGTLAGRIKRRWFQHGKKSDANWAHQLYAEALEESLETLETAERDRLPAIHAQIYYHAINVAFLEFAALGDTEKAKQHAQVALEHSMRSNDTDAWWNAATRGEAYLYLNEHEKALEAYEEALRVNPENWQLMSTGQQANRVAEIKRDKALHKALLHLFNPEVEIKEDDYADAAWK